MQAAPSAFPFPRLWRRLGVDASSLCLLASLALALFAWQGQPKAVGQWNWLDICSEGGSALVAGWWSLVVRGARPPGAVTRWLVGGLAALALGNWVDCLDEFYKLGHGVWWGHVLESGLGLAGTLSLTLGLLLWRQEQQWLSTQLRQRERLFRDHRAFDRLTCLADAGYLRRQLQLECSRRAGEHCALVMLDLGDYHGLARRLGPDEQERLLWQLGQLLLLNLRSEDLLCRYAGGRFAALLPNTDAQAAQSIAAELVQAVEAWRFRPAQGQAPRLQARSASAVLQATPQDAAGTAIQALLDRLNQQLAPQP